MANDQSNTAEQPDFVRALLRPGAWPHAPASVELIETHISWVLLTGDYAYKIKKPVNFGFLDFSSLEKRLACCREEVRLNRRLAPEIYLDVVALCGDPAEPTVGGEANIFEYAVRMRQFDLDQGFDRLLAAGKLDPFLMDLTATTLTDFHASAAVADPAGIYGTAAAVREPVQENIAQIRRYTQSTTSASEPNAGLEHLAEWSNNRCRELEEVFQERLRNERVRECHGDLHLRNIIYWLDRVIPFDCIEFNPNLRWIDVISELAFLLMDLDDHDCEPLSRKLLNAWLERSGDYEALQLLPFYLVYRALVRAKVACLRSLQPGTDRVEARREFANYMHLAERYTRQQKPRLLITHGLSGSGKTWASQQLLEAFPLIRLRSDVERKRLHGLATADRGGEAKNLYSSSASEKTYARLLQLTSQLLDWGYSVIVDAAFLQQQQRQAFTGLARQQHTPFLIVHCHADEAVQQQRLVQRQSSDTDASDADIAVLSRQRTTVQVLTSAELEHSLSVDSDSGVEKVLAWLSDQSG